MTNLITQLADNPVWRHRSMTPRLLVVVGATLRYWSKTPGLVMGDAATSRHGSMMLRWLDKSRSKSVCRVALQMIVGSHVPEFFVLSLKTMECVDDNFIITEIISD
ncbi:hypothetical protein B296_00011892 [Ensete ventricosum]|uniref:Uncharacterized protein n=1 Tax=Ensete ventricosum TaxID=4639 RepID=A0A427B3J9_ENSVE|nr:hypothetical protein B296_00011892 [Ensete ventricosum]